MKKLMAIVLLGSAMISTTAFGFGFFGGGCCDSDYSSYQTVSYDCGCDYDYTYDYSDSCC